MEGQFGLFETFGTCLEACALVEADRLSFPSQLPVSY